MVLSHGTSLMSSKGTLFSANAILTFRAFPFRRSGMTQHGCISRYGSLLRAEHAGIVGGQLAESDFGSSAKQLSLMGDACHKCGTYC